jgi:tetrahydromethanopterin S-methyltransferase subunit G
MDEETKAAFEDVMARLDGVEKRLDTVDLTLKVLAEQVRLSVGLLTDFGRRMTDLEKKD